MTHYTQKGNVLVIILVGIVLFALLGYTVTRTSTFSSGGLSDHQAKVYANEIINYSEKVEGAVQMMMSSGSSIYDISFENDQLTNYDHSPVVDDQHKIFHTAGGGLRYRPPSATWLNTAYSAEDLYGEWFLTGHSCLANYGTGGTSCEGDGTSVADLILFLPYVKEEVCGQINLVLNNSTSLTPPTNSTASMWGDPATKYTGAFANTGADGRIGDVFTGLQKTGCIMSAAGGSSVPVEGSYVFYRALVPR